MVLFCFWSNIAIRFIYFIVDLLSDLLISVKLITKRASTLLATWRKLPIMLSRSPGILMRRLRWAMQHYFSIVLDLLGMLWVNWWIWILSINIYVSSEVAFFYLHMSLSSACRKQYLWIMIHMSSMAQFRMNLNIAFYSFSWNCCMKLANLICISKIAALTNDNLMCCRNWTQHCL